MSPVPEAMTPRRAQRRPLGRVTSRPMSTSSLPSPFLPPAGPQPGPPGRQPAPAASESAAVAAPARWEVTILAHYGQAVLSTTDLLSDLLVSIAWGAFAGLAGATVLRPKLAALMRDAQARFAPRARRSDSDSH